MTGRPWPTATLMKRTFGRPLSDLYLNSLRVFRYASVAWYNALAPLERDGLINSRVGSDKRIRIVSLTKRGDRLVAHSEQRWDQAQKALMEAIGEGRWTVIRNVLRETTRLVRHWSPSEQIGD